MKHIYLLLLFIPLSILNCSIENDESESIELDDIKYQELSLDISGMNTYGNIYYPKDYIEGKSYPLVIMSHSANINSDSLKTYAQRTALIGYLVYCFDYPGSSSSSRSEDIDNCTIFTEVETLKEIIDYFVSQDEVENIYLFGTSMGGAVSSLVAEEKQDEISGLILFYPAYNICELLVKYPINVSEEYLEQLTDYDIYEHIGSFNKDVLIVHGKNDFLVPYSYSEKASELYSSCELVIVEGANHGFNKDNYYFNNQYDQETWSYAESYLLNHR